AAGGAIGSPVPCTATSVEAPPPEIFTLPESTPADCGVKRTYTGVEASVAPVNGIVAVGPQALLSLETSKSVEGDVTVNTPGAPVRSAPVMSKLCEAETFPIVTLPKSASVPAVITGAPAAGGVTDDHVVPTRTSSSSMNGVPPVLF